MARRQSTAGGSWPCIKTVPSEEQPDRPSSKPGLPLLLTQLPEVAARQPQQQRWRLAPPERRASPESSLGVLGRRALNSTGRPHTSDGTKQQLIGLPDRQINVGGLPQRRSLQIKPSTAGAGRRRMSGPTEVVEEQCYRSEEERNAGPDRLNLDGQGLTSCIKLVGEERLRLLNYQNNQISQISGMGQLRNLVFLDLYNNQLEKIDQLGSLSKLRVLMLGKNKIQAIQNLEPLRQLEVLDLHSNMISLMAGVSHLTELRVLNLAGNAISQAGPSRLAWSEAWVAGGGARGRTAAAGGAQLAAQ